MQSELFYLPPTHCYQQAQVLRFKAKLTLKSAMQLTDLMYYHCQPNFRKLCDNGYVCLKCYNCRDKNMKYMSRDMTKPTKWVCAQPRLIRVFAGCTIICWFCHATAHIRKLIFIASTFYFMPFHASCSIFITCTGENTGKFSEKIHKIKMQWDLWISANFGSFGPYSASQQ